MKLASIKHGRDGKLVIVNSDLSAMVDATDIAPTLQSALDDWAAIEPKLKRRFEQLEAGECKSTPFQQEQCASPLPRAFQVVLCVREGGTLFILMTALLPRGSGRSSDGLPETWEGRPPASPRLGKTIF